VDGTAPSSKNFVDGTLPSSKNLVDGASKKNQGEGGREGQEVVGWSKKGDGR
jgi:hypothetical protein